MANSKVKSVLKNLRIIENSPERGKSQSSALSNELLTKSAEDFWAQISGNQGEDHHGKAKDKKSEKKAGKKEQKKYWRLCH